jgi:hypothetical protein
MRKIGSSAFLAMILLFSMMAASYVEASTFKGWQIENRGGQYYQSDA